MEEQLAGGDGDADFALESVSAAEEWAARSHAHKQQVEQQQRNCAF